jgi:hypothetical protein
VSPVQSVLTGTGDHPASIHWVKGKVHPRTGHEGPEGDWRYSSTVSLISTIDGGGWSKPRPGPFTPGKDPVPIV